jgi:hypothetical protein
MIDTQELTEKELESNYNEFIDLIKKSFKGDRLDKLLHMYSEEELGLSLITAPASGKEYFHCAWAGGYLIHVMNVIRTSSGVEKLYKAIGGTIDYTESERIFSAMHHDLGKLGDSTDPAGSYYVAQDSDWNRKRGEMFKFNPNLQHMDVTHRSLYLLQYYDIKVTRSEWIGIYTSDGLYNEANEAYLKSYNPDHKLKCRLPYIIHTADFLSCQMEYDKWKAGK